MPKNVKNKNRALGGSLFVNNVFSNVFDDKPREMRCLIDGEGGGGSTQSFISPLAVADKYLKSNDSEFTLENFQNHWGLSYSI